LSCDATPAGLFSLRFSGLPSGIGVGVSVGVGVKEGVGDGVGVNEGVGDGVGVKEGVMVGDGDGVTLGVRDGACVADGVAAVIVGSGVVVGTEAIGVSTTANSSGVAEGVTISGFGVISGTVGTGVADWQPTVSKTSIQTIKWINRFDLNISRYLPKSSPARAKMHIRYAIAPGFPAKKWPGQDE
jgi:hypothetical protein